MRSRFRFGRMITKSFIKLLSTVQYLLYVLYQIVCKYVHAWLCGFGLTHVKRENAMLFPFCYLSLMNTPLYRWWQAEDVNIKNTNPPHVEDPSVHCSCFCPQTHSTALIIFNYVNNIFVKFCVAGRLRPFQCAVSCMYFVRGRHVCFGGDFCFYFLSRGWFLFKLSNRVSD